MCRSSPPTRNHLQLSGVPEHSLLPSAAAAAAAAAAADAERDKYKIKTPSNMLIAAPSGGAAPAGDSKDSNVSDASSNAEHKAEHDGNTHSLDTYSDHPSLLAQMVQWFGVCLCVCVFDRVSLCVLCSDFLTDLEKRTGVQKLYLLIGNATCSVRRTLLSHSVLLLVLRRFRWRSRWVGTDGCTVRFAQSRSFRSICVSGFYVV